MVSTKTTDLTMSKNCCREPIFVCLYLTVFTGKSNMGEVLLGFVMLTFIPFPDSSPLEGYMNINSLIHINFVGRT